MAPRGSKVAPCAAARASASSTGVCRNPGNRLSNSAPSRLCGVSQRYRISSNPRSIGQTGAATRSGHHGIRAALPRMVTQGAGTIINISSGAATGALEGWSHYCATKAAVLSLTKVTHKEMHDKGIRVMGLSPGTVATDMQREIKASGINPVSQLDWSAHISPDDVAKAIAWLGTPAADPWRGQDFSLKTPDGRTAAGLAPLTAG